MPKKLLVQRPIDEATEYYDVMDDVLGTITGDLKVTLPDAPTWKGDLYLGQLPPNMSHLSDMELGELLTIVTQWKNYLRVKLSYYKGYRDDCEKQLRVQKAYLRKQFRAAPATTEDEAKFHAVNDRIELDKRFQDVQRDHLYYGNLVEILDAAYSAAESDFNAVSRVITLHGQARGGEQRAHGALGRRVGALD